MKISLNDAKELLQSGKVVAIPTETVYGLAASIQSPTAIDEIYILKNRPATNPLIVHIADVSVIQNYALKIPTTLYDLANAFWPGPLTVILHAETDQIPHNARAGLHTVAFRVPAHPFALDIIQDVGPIVMPSANRSGRPSATCRQHVEIDFGKDFPVLDGGFCNLGVESTILFFDGDVWKLARLGAISAEQFLPIIGYCPEPVKESKKAPICPGQHHRHYSPKARLSSEKDSTTIVLGFSDRVYTNAEQVFSLGPSDDPNIVAANLYNSLRELDAEGIDEAWVDMDIPKDGLWATIAERLQRACVQ